MAEENIKSMNFFTRIKTSIKDFDKYTIFAVEKTSKAMAYLAILMLIFAIVVALIFTYEFGEAVNRGINYFRDNITESTYSDGELSINTGEELKFINNEELIPLIIINTNSTDEQETEYISTLSQYTSGIIILKDKIIYKNESLSQSIEYKYNDIAANYDVTEFEKEDVLTFISNVNNINLYGSFFVVLTIYMFIIYFISTLVDIDTLSILSFLFARIVGMKIKFKATFNMSVYALTLPIILNLIYVVVNSITGFEVKYFQWMYTTISYIYMIVAILIIKADFINRQAELMKIVEEQEKVKRQLELEEQKKKEEEEKQKQKDKEEQKDKNDEDKKNKKKNKKDEVGKTGLAPE